MFCKYCGKPLSDGARFCGFCGKDQESIIDNSGATKTAAQSTNRNLRAILCTLITLFLNSLIVIFALFTDLFNIKFGNDFFSTDFKIGIFDLFDNAKTINSISMNSDSLKQVSSSMITFGVILLIALALFVIYYLYYIFTYSFTKQDQFVSIFGKNYNNFSIIPACVFIMVTVIGMYNIVGEYGSITPTATLISIYVFCGIQFIINKVYLYMEYPV